VTDDLSVTVEDVRRAAHAADDATDLASVVPLQQSVEPVMPALPGSRSAQSAAVLGSIWRDRLVAWCADLAAYAAALTAVADEYLAADGQTADEFQAVGR